MGDVIRQHALKNHQNNDKGVHIYLFITRWAKISVTKEDSEVRGKCLQLGRTYHSRRTLRKKKTTGKATGNHPGKYVIRETEYAATCTILQCTYLSLIHI